MKKSIKQLEYEIKCINEQWQRDREYFHKVINRESKCMEAIKTAWRRVHPEDQDFMRKFSKENKDPELFDVYNGLLYSFGRPDENGIVFTRLFSWRK